MKRKRENEPNKQPVKKAKSKGKGKKVKADTPPPVTLNHDVLFEILPLLSNDTLLSVRAVSREFRQRADDLLARHIVIRRVHRVGRSVGEEVAQTKTIAITTPTTCLPTFQKRSYPVSKARLSIPKADTSAKPRGYPLKNIKRKGIFTHNVGKNKPGWSAPFCSTKEQFTKLENMRLRLQKLEEKIWISARKDREDTYDAHLKDYADNEEHIRRTLAKVRTVDLVGRTIDESGIAPFLTNLHYVRLVFDPKDYGYNVSRDEWRGNNPHVPLAAPTYVFTNDHIHLSPPVETHRAIVQVLYNGGFVNFKTMSHMKTITKLVFVFVESTTAVSSIFYGNKAAAIRQLAHYLAKRFGPPNVYEEADWMLSSLPTDRDATSSTLSVTDPDSIKTLLIANTMTAPAMRSTSTTSQERKNATKCINNIRFQTMDEWRSRVGEEEYHLATEPIKA
ncbi:uncharacterized protein EHS24_001314 [Apiotrichum porosum]|uniref:F-box domain-containing protein n=1 Tax=Apiotrichum porosum TaxID=105984 RepID=A0A427XKI3_9TREE|nr:uncharacterized protein EHS24_001314 [Apiotrichum porosum]RSH79274.1 hypothetical protein EHS24_001314 [Apiotrichum porosum]